MALPFLCYRSESPVFSNLKYLQNQGCNLGRTCVYILQFSPLAIRLTVNVFYFFKIKRLIDDFRPKELFGHINVSISSFLHTTHSLALCTDWPRYTAIWKHTVKATRMKLYVWSGFKSNCNRKSTVCIHVDIIRKNRFPKCFLDGADFAEVLQPTLTGLH